MTYVTRLFVDEGSEFVGRGNDKEAALADCLSKVKEHLEGNLHAELAPGVLIPAGELENVPVVPDAEYQLVIFERTSHNSGHAYSWRYFALPFGRYKLGDSKERVEVTPSAPVLISTMDSNSDAWYPLPKRSVEYKDGQWMQSAGVDYNY